jgi:8-oxo-dGTP diphosphatase
MPSSAQHSVSVAAVVVNDAGQVLMTQRRDNGHWEPPGGVLELSESILDGLRREVREETGFDIEPDRLTGVYKNMPRGIVALVFRAHVIGGSPTDATDEAARVRWLNHDEIVIRCAEAYAVRVLDALSDSAPAIRAHDGVTIRRDLAALPN